MTQCTNVPAGASGSSTIRAKDRVPVGAPLQASGGEIPFPLHVYDEGMGWPAAKAGLESESVIKASGDWVVWAGGPPQEARAGASNKTMSLFIVKKNQSTFPK